MKETAVNIWDNAVSYVGVKLVAAVKMALGDYNTHRGWQIPSNENPYAPGYMVKYPDGYISWCPEAQFEEANELSDNLSFGHAIAAAKNGNKIARVGWNDKDMWVTCTPGKILDMEVDDIWTGNVRDMAIANGGKVEILPYMSMKTADNKLQIGWAASQSDMQANDWMVVG